MEMKCRASGARLIKWTSLAFPPCRRLIARKTFFTLYLFIKNIKIVYAY